MIWCRMYDFFWFDFFIYWSYGIVDVCGDGFDKYDFVSNFVCVYEFGFWVMWFCRFFLCDCCV